MYRFCYLSVAWRLPFTDTALRERMSQHFKQSFRLEALHVFALWSLAVVQPVFDVLSANAEFFVAHDARPADLVVFVLLLCGLVPIVCLLTIEAASRLGPRARSRATGMVLAALCGVIALQVIARTTSIDAGPGMTIALAAGVVVALAYHRLPALRLFATLLTPAIVVVPVVFVLQPGVRSLLRADEVEPWDVAFESTPPVVMVVFDQLPLATLMGRDGQIEPALYPSFASLSRTAHWFRNATAVAGTTEVAVPALLTGVRPREGQLPVVADHPGNLFTLLGSRYRSEAVEPITRLCPETLCVRRRPSTLSWFWSVLPDLTVVYLHIVLPEDLTARLPPVTQNWKDFVVTDTALNRWLASRSSGRPQGVIDFVDSIQPVEDGERPPLHFLHVLLPHEPWVYLPTGQRYSALPVAAGLDRDNRWSTDEMAVLRNYQRHLLQVRFADRLLGQILDRLREVGLFEESLIVVAADHGASFLPGVPFRRPRLSSFAEIGGVPLFIKTPGQRAGRVSNANVETVDVVPTIAGVLGTQVPWRSDGVDVLASNVEFRADKRYFYTDDAEPLTAPADLTRQLGAVVTRKFARFHNPTGFDQPLLGLHDDLVGQTVDQLDVRTASPVAIVVDFPVVFTDANPTGDFVPAHVTGAILDRDDIRDRPVLAVALNGIVAAITQPYEEQVAGRPDAWEVIVDPGLLVAGANKVVIYTVHQEGDDEPVLRPAYRSDVAGNLVAENLIMNQAGPVFGVATSGFYDIEWMGQRPFRWTTDEAVVQVPIDPAAPLTELVIEVLMTGPVQKRLTVSVDDCHLTTEEIFGAWRQALPLTGCRLDRDVMDVRLEAEVRMASPTDTRDLGVAVGRVEVR